MAAQAPWPLSWPGELQRYIEHLRVERRLAPRSVQMVHDALLGCSGQPQPRRWRCARCRPRMCGAGPRSCASGRWRRAASPSTCRPGAGCTAGGGAAARCAPTRSKACARPRRRSRCPRRCRWSRRCRWRAFEPTSGDPALRARDHCIVELLYGSGLRVAELVGLDLRGSDAAAGWIDAADASAQVLGKGSKRRSVPVGPRGADGAARLARAARADRRAGRAGAVRQPARHAAHRQPGALPAEERWRCRPGCRRMCTRTCCATASRRTCCSPAATCARCRNCWATPTSRPRRSTRGSTSSTWPRSTTLRIRGRRSGRRHEGDPPARRQGALAAAPPPLGVRTAASPRARPTPARRCASRPHDGRFLAWGAYSPQFDDPRARLELRRGRAHRRGLLRAARRSRRWRCARAWPSPATACAWCTARPTACPGWSSTATATRCARSSCPPAASAGRTSIADALLRRHRPDAAVRTLRCRRARARRAAGAQRLAAR